MNISDWRILYRDQPFLGLSKATGQESATTVGRAEPASNAARKKQNMKTTKQIVSEHTYHLWDQGGAGPEVLIEEFWLAVKAEFDCIENPPWATVWSGEQKSST